MILYHATTRQNLDAIRQQGLLVAKAQGKEKAVWLHTSSRIHWAIAHTQKRHGVDLTDIVILEVKVSRSWVRRAWTGLWKCSRDIAPEAFTVKGTGETFAESPIQE